MEIPANLEGRIALILGASSGIGRGITEAIAQYKPKGIIIAARRVNLLEEIAKKIKDNYAIDPYIMQTDVTSEDSLKKLINTSVEKYGQIDIVINSAGLIQREILIGETELDLIRQIIHTNTIQAIQLASLITPYFERQKFGTYIVISSQAGKYAFAGEAPYCASKAGVDHAIRAIDEEYKLLRKNKKETYIFSICPGFIDTEEARAKFSGVSKDIWKKALSPDKFGNIVVEYILNPAGKYLESGSVHLIETLRI